MIAERIRAIASSPVLLVATDFDGTISPLVPDPEAARVDQRCAAALTRLESLPRTRVAVVSGRSLAWLRNATAWIPPGDHIRSGLLLFGSHGAENGMEDAREPSGDEQHRARMLADLLEQLALEFPGTHVEVKPYGAAIHFRRVGEHIDAVLRPRVEAIAAEQGAIVRHGSMVYELTTTPATKGEALTLLRRRVGASHTVFLGDDETDEQAISALGHHDLTVRVGPGESRAMIRLNEPADVAVFLEQLVEARASHLSGAQVPIVSHALLSDQRTIAIIAPGARVSWLCLPRIDAPAVFAELVGGPAAGTFSIYPSDAQPAPPRVSYVGDSMVLRSEWDSLAVTDYLDASAGRAYQRSGRTDLVRAIEGRGTVRIQFSPRLDFGRIPTRLEIVESGLVVEGGADPMVLRAPGVRWRIEEEGQHHSAYGELDLNACGGSAVLELRYGAENLRASSIAEPQRREQNARFWSSWAGSLRLPLHAPRLLVRSALVLKALCFGPTGAIAAAATTSLPEHMGGCRNWDYRFCWPRDAAMSATALLRLGNTGHAIRLADWLMSIVDRLDSPERLRPIYTVSGHHLGPEADLSELAGYGESRPVRVSNAAAQQVQLDVFGPIADMIATMAEQGVPISPDAWRLVRAIVQAVQTRWREPDHGIWEIRAVRRHYVHSKVMCWHAVDRAMVVHDAVLGRENPEWRSLRDAIRDDVLGRGWSDRAAAFTLAYGSDELDAGALTVGLTGLIPADDLRFVRTVDAVNTRLRDGAAVRRYLFDDGLPGPEGGMIICSTWLVEALAMVGRTEEALALFNSVCKMAGPTGLLSEQWDPGNSLALGNFPQAYSHLGLINAAVRLAAMQVPAASAMP